MRKNGTRSGYSEFRYGETRPVYNPAKQHRAIFKGDQRKHLVQKTAEELAEWTASPFQNEAACRHGLRQALCEASYPWERADLEAAGIVAEGLKANHAVRPNWAEGQPEHTAGHDFCVECQAPLNDEQIARRDRFCSPACGTAFVNKRELKWTAMQGEVERSARRLGSMAARPKVECQCCGKTFRTRGNRKAGETAQFCSVQCAKQAIRTIPDLVCENPACGKTFKTHAYHHKSKHHYCSSACAHADRERWEPKAEGECLLCGKPFVAKVGAKFCSKNCNARHYQYRSGRVVPTRVTPIVFDFFITLPANQAQPKWLSPARFDEMVAA